MTNVQMSEATHLFYNPQTNEVASTQYRKDLEMYEVIRGDYRLTITFVMGMDSIMEKRGTEVWHFIGIL